MPLLLTIITFSLLGHLLTHGSIAYFLADHLLFLRFGLLIQLSTGLLPNLIACLGCSC